MEEIIVIVKQLSNFLIYLKRLDYRKIYFAKKNSELLIILFCFVVSCTFGPFPRTDKG